MNHLEQVEAARAALNDHLQNHAAPEMGENPAEWWQTRLTLIKAVLTSERAAIDAGVLSDFTAEF